MSVYKFADCDCCFEIDRPAIKEGAIPFLKVDVNNFPTCKKTFDLISTGKTKGIFQLESKLGRKWAKRVKPENYEHMCALGSILRPGTLNSMSEIDGESMTEHYAMRRHNEEESIPIDESIKDILSPTYNIMCFQEQLTAIAVKVAGFNPLQADDLRKGVGKKSEEIMSRMGKLFLEGCKTNKVISEEKGKQLWDQIKKSSRYLFNRSHAMSYGLTGLDSAYIKAHFPVQFFANWLYYAKEKQDPMEEKRELVEDAKFFGIKIETPDVVDMKKRVYTDMVVVKFGICDVKGVGEAQFKKFKTHAKSFSKPIKDFTWEEFIIYVSDAVSTTFMNNLIMVGGFKKMTNKSRNLQKLEYSVWSELTDKEKLFIQQKYQVGKNLLDILKECCKIKKEGGMCFTQKRCDTVKSQISILENPITSTEDYPNMIADAEEDLLGVAISCSRVDDCDLSMVNLTCKEFNYGGSFHKIYLGVTIKDVRKAVTKTGPNAGKENAFLVIEDGTGSLSDVACWNEVYAKYGNMLVKKNNVMLEGYKNKKTGNFTVNKVYQL